MGTLLKSLGYFGFSGQDLEAWKLFSTRLLGTESSFRDIESVGKVLSLRMDEYEQRLILLSQPEDAPAFFGFDVETEQTLTLLKEYLLSRGLALTVSTPAERAVRCVQDMVWTVDPDGNRLEFYWGMHKPDKVFQPDRPIGGFVTGAQGIGHVVLVVNDLDRSESFYCDVLGFRVSDYVLTPTRRAFMRINPRHHTVALAERPGGGIAHIMVEVKDFDDVGRAYDVALSDYPQQIYSTLGRHSNDHMTSFYVQTPAGFPIEYGWGGRTVDEETWKVEKLFGPSLWGHDRVGGAPAARAAALKQRDFAFREGIRAPLTCTDPRHGS